LIELFCIILILILVSKLIEDGTKIPFVLSIFVLGYIGGIFFDLSVLKDNFKEIIYLMLPVVLIADVLELSVKELEDNVWDIVYLSVWAVILSVVLAVLVIYYLDIFDNLSFFYILVLVVPLMATDLVSVASIFSQFNLPYRLKLYANGESLFNDITAMIIFFCVAIPLVGSYGFEWSWVFGIAIFMVILSVVLGFVFGLIGYLVFEYSKQSLEEFVTIYIMASLSFVLAEHMGGSGILSVVVSVMYFKYLYDKGGHYKKNGFLSLLKNLRHARSNLVYRAYKKESYYLGLFANGIIFITMAVVVDLGLLWKYKVQIASLFVITTFIRYGMMYLFVWYKKYLVYWANILTLSGMKGSLAVIMVVSLSNDFEYKEMILTVVLGVVVLSVFVYSILLSFYLYTQKENLIIDKAQEYNIHIQNIKELVNKEPITGVYNQIVFEELVDKEISRAQEYDKSFSIIAFESNVENIVKLKNSFLKKSDYLGRFNSEVYAILRPHTSLEKSIVFVEKIKKNIDIKNIVVVKYLTGDSKQMIYEKIADGIKQKNKKIDIEV
jgi:CPA1 family monovalent cation:H+ antiporter